MDSQPGQLVLIASVVIDDPDRVDDLVAEHLAELGVTVATMGAGGHEHHHVVEVHHAIELGQDGRDHQVPRLWPGAVTGRDRHGLATLNALAQRWSSHGFTHRAAQDRGRIGGGGVMTGSTTVVRAGSASMTSPDSPYAKRTFMIRLSTRH